MDEAESRAWKALVAERLEDAISRKGIEKQQLAAAIGVTSAAVSGWVSEDGGVAWKRLAEICRVLNESADWLLGLRPSPKAAALELVTPVGPEDFVVLPCLEDELAAGNVMVQTDRYSDSYYAFRQSWLDSNRMKGRKLVTARIARSGNGESMKETIQPGALVLVDLTPVTPDQFTPRGVYIVRTPGGDGGVTVKRVVLRPRYVICLSDNPAFDPFCVEFKDEVSNVVVGRVVWWGNEAA